MTPPASAKRLLIFEDNRSINVLMKYLCQKNGFETQIEGDGTRAVDLVKEFRPDLIVLDIVMPGKGGFETCADLRAAGVTIPIIMLTSQVVPEDKSRGLAAGANSYLHKPFNPKELLAEIHKLLPPP